MNLPKKSDNKVSLGRLTVLPSPLLQLQSLDGSCDLFHLRSTLSFHGAKHLTWIRTSARSICGRFFWQLLAMQDYRDHPQDVRSTYRSESVLILLDKTLHVPWAGVQIKYYHYMSYFDLRVPLGDWQDEEVWATS